jgi:phosphoserine aminotransferase
MLCVEDYLDALGWAEGIGGLKALRARADRNLGLIAAWAVTTPWVDFLAEDSRALSNTSVCLKIVDPRVTKLDAEKQAAIPKKIDALLEAEGVAFDINGYRDAPPGLRIWAGATVEAADLEALFPWLNWAFETALAGLTQSK